jgi:hypothetical protein
MKRSRLLSASTLIGLALFLSAVRKHRVLPNFKKNKSKKQTTVADDKLKYDQMYGLRHAAQFRVGDAGPTSISAEHHEPYTHKEAYPKLILAAQWLTAIFAASLSVPQRFMPTMLLSKYLRCRPLIGKRVKRSR